MLQFSRIVRSDETELEHESTQTGHSIEHFKGDEIEKNERSGM